jgi:hypothetical protein
MPDGARACVSWPLRFPHRMRGRGSRRLVMAFFAVTALFAPVVASGPALADGMSGTAAAAAPVSAAAAAAPRAVAVSGRVLDARVLSTPRGASVVIPNGLHPIAGARVSVAFPSGTTVNTVTNRVGQFTVARPAGTPAKTTATVSVHEPGFGTWRETGVPAALPHGNYPILTVLLNVTAQSWAYPRNPTITGRPGPASGRGPHKPARAPSARRAGCTGYFSNTLPPSTIRVDNVGTGTIQTYNFQYYAENVLPDEWPNPSPPAAYEAGAIAVKEYGWYWVNNWRGGSLNGTCYDVQGGTYGNTGLERDCDTNYQCFIPGTATAATNDAFYSTWPSLARRSGQIFETSYRAGTSACARVDGNTMYQNGSVTCANDGYAWPRIITTFYDNVAFSVGSAMCTFGTSSTACINRNGGGYTSGTKVIGWYKDSDNNENFYGVLLTSWCNSGYVTETCPFTVGSGLNARYNGDPIVSLDTSNNQCVGANSTWDAAVLGGCVPNGGAFVESNVNGVFLISVGVSNHWYGVVGTYNAPYWLVWDGAFGDPLDFIAEAINSWTCQPGGNSVCGKL